ncbi:thermostable beta-glucosidase, partial [Entamoeba invadens IP1]
RVDESVEKIIHFTNAIKPRRVEVNAKEVALRVAEDGCVLLKNSGETLPLKNIKTVGLFGTGAYGPFVRGIGSGQTHPSHVVSLKESFEKRGIHLEDNMNGGYSKYLIEQNNRTYETYMKTFNFFLDYDEPVLKDESVAVCASTSDVGLFVLSRISGEFRDRKDVSFRLSDHERDAIKKMSHHYHAKNKKVVMILNICGPIEIESWIDLVDSIIVVWLNGEEHGNAITHVLFGDVNPSGRLPLSFPENLANIPSHSFPGNPRDNPNEVIYDEDIYVGYRYYTSFEKRCSFPFGFGLSYTEFEYSVPIVILDKKNITFSVNVKNNGKCNGKDVVLFFVAPPKNTEFKMPVRELRGFAKTDLIKIDSSFTINITRSYRDLSSFDEKSHSWILHKGTYKLELCKDANTIIRTTEFIIDKEIITQSSRSYCTPQHPFNVLSK